MMLCGLFEIPQDFILLSDILKTSNPYIKNPDDTKVILLADQCIQNTMK